jgi:hypothetical protein
LVAIEGQPQTHEKSESVFKQKKDSQKTEVLVSL